MGRINDGPQYAFGTSTGFSRQMLNIFYGPAFEGLSDDSAEKANVLWNAEETFRLFYLMVKNMMTAKEEEERSRQIAVGR